MSLRIPFPTAVDPRVHREEEMTLARKASYQRSARSAVPETPDDAAMGSVPAPPPNTNRRRIVLPDPVAFRFLEEDPLVSVVERRHVLPGYELYLVEQWACSRQSPTLVIAAYTGDPRHSVVVGVLEVPADEEEWSPRLRVYYKAIHQYHARPKETEVGELMVTNLSSFPSALTVIPVPEGDIRKHRREFIVNENLKRLGCAGRSGLTLAEPTSATQAKFMQMYKTSDRIPFYQAVIELVKLCQVALFLFGMLEQEYIDGLLCDITETAINDWWTAIGSEHFNIEPTDGILGPTTVAALLGTLLGARNRLSYWGAPVSKDAFDVESMKKGIGSFQKSMRMERTRRLDPQTLLKLHSVTAKAAAGDGGWGVQKAVKSTVAEIGGKRGELVIGMVGGRDKANIGDVETLDLNKVISLVSGERPKWLWHGKPRRTLQGDEQDHAPSAFGRGLRDEKGLQGGGRRTHSVPTEEEGELRRNEDPSASLSPLQPTHSLPVAAETAGGDRDALRRTVFKSVAGKVNDARSGLGRIRDAVGGGLRGHVSRPSKDDTPDTAASGYSSPSIATLAQSSAAVTSPVAVGKAFSWKVRPEDYLPILKDKEVGCPASAEPPLGANESGGRLAAASGDQPFAEPYRTLDDKERLELALVGMGKEVRSTNASAAGSVVADGDLEGPVLAIERNSDGLLLSLQRRHSIDCLASLRPHPHEARYPHRLSFSAAEDAVLSWEDLVSLTTDPKPDSNDLASLRSQAELSFNLYARLQQIQAGLAPWTSSKLASVTALDHSLEEQQTELQALHEAANEAYERARHTSNELVADERARLAETVKDIDMLAAKLEYEIGALVSRVNEVEDGVAQFEAQVDDVERRAEELKEVLETESWLHWLVRTITGIGTGPNITSGVPPRMEGTR
ncbi:uncharacterized protein P884DRAFT_251657 [Thermothelomyces heterothallicus CBS 202.75]|uniref:uncharacterized protein n=1 Tax=Thermothelomyces heterothallicus CBS 202.75 TaxID=1149848 RepID=UPI00374467D8